MPFYEYECTQCRYYAEVLQKISDAPLRKCPSCGRNTFRKLVSAPVFRLKGSGWYETDFKGEREAKRNLAADAEESKAAGVSQTATQGEAQGEAKSEAKSEAKAKGETKGESASAEGAAARAAESKTAVASPPKARAAGPSEPVLSAGRRRASGAHSARPAARRSGKARGRR